MAEVLSELVRQNTTMKFKVGTFFFFPANRKSQEKDFERKGVRGDSLKDLMSQRNNFARKQSTKATLSPVLVV